MHEQRQISAEQLHFLVERKSWFPFSRIFPDVGYFLSLFRFLLWDHQYSAYVGEIKQEEGFEFWSLSLEMSQFDLRSLLWSCKHDSVKLHILSLSSCLFSLWPDSHKIFTFFFKTLRMCGHMIKMEKNTVKRNYHFYSFYLNKKP